jgi:prolyl 4-hydroxylase
MSSNPVNAAYDYASAGRLSDAVAILEAAGARGNAAAFAELATWYLRGDLIPRDLIRARAVLRHAVSIGHVDGALLEIALTATGSGGPANWSAALDLLRVAARNDPVARAHLDLVEAMALNDRGYPTALGRTEQLSDDPLVARYPAFLSEAECKHIAHATSALLAPSMVVDPASGRQIQNPIRTSYEALIGPTREDLVIRAINNRIAALSETTVEQGESLTILRYAPGQQYRLHLDTIQGTTNQRIATVLLYLNQGFEGGETIFPSLNLSVLPKAGDAILFANVDPAGIPDQRSRHAGLPVKSGHKWLATRWIRARPLDPWNWTPS